MCYFLDDSIETKYIAALGKLVDELPPANKALAEILLLFLSRVGEHSSKNKMTPANLAIVFGQILLKPEIDTIESMMNAAKVTGIMRFMIENFEKIFPVSFIFPYYIKFEICIYFLLLFFIKKQRTRNVPRSDASGSKSTEEQEKLKRIKDTVDDAIVLVQKKLNALSTQVQDTNDLGKAIEIARRVRTAQKVLFPPGEVPQSKRLPLSAKNACGFKLLSAKAERQGKRKTMEDASVLLDNLANEFTNLSGTWGFYAVYDGHGGSNTSSICSNMLHRQLCNSNKLTENIKGAFQIAYKETDAFALKESESKGFKDGSTAVTALIRANTLHIANAGDSEAVLCKVK